MNQRNSNQVSEANVTRYFPSTVLEPFGVIGMPSLYSKEKIENALLGVIREIAERMDRENAARAKEWYSDPRIRDLLKAHDKAKP